MATELHSVTGGKPNADDGSGYAERYLTIPETVDPIAVYGARDEVLRRISDAVPEVDIMARGNDIRFCGPIGRVGIVAGLFEELISLARAGTPLNADAAGHAVSLLTSAKSASDAVRVDAATLSAAGKKVKPQSPGQALYMRAIQSNTIVFGIGPAGTGKTYLAMALAVESLLSGAVKRIILTRPAVEAGENLGFLPGSLTEKINPYLRPLYDALYDLMDPEAIPKLMAANTIEVAPLAYMRGRTLNDAFVVLDEAQNTTAQQMKMFLTRLGFNSKMVVTGDTSQVDLPRGVNSGLRVAERVVDGIPDVSVCRLTSADVVRHELVGKIIDAYDRYEAAHPDTADDGGYLGRGRFRRNQ